MKKKIGTIRMYGLAAVFAVLLTGVCLTVTGAATTSHSEGDSITAVTVTESKATEGEVCGHAARHTYTSGDGSLATAISGISSFRLNEMTTLTFVANFEDLGSSTKRQNYYVVWNAGTIKGYTTDTVTDDLNGNTAEDLRSYGASAINGGANIGDCFRWIVCPGWNVQQSRVLLYDAIYIGEDLYEEVKENSHRIIISYAKSSDSSYVNYFEVNSSGKLTYDSGWQISKSNKNYYQIHDSTTRYILVFIKGNAGALQEASGNTDKALQSELDNVKICFSAYNVTLDEQSGSGGTENVYYRPYCGFKQAAYITNLKTPELATVDFMKVSVPERDGYTFEGYYSGKNGTGTRYIDENGNFLNKSGNAITTKTFGSAAIAYYDSVVKADTTWYAYWKPETYTVKYYDGITNKTVLLTDTAEVPSAYTVNGESRLKNIPAGYTFAGSWKYECYRNNKLVTDLSGTITEGKTFAANKFASGDVIKLYANWTTTYTVKYYEGDGSTTKIAVG